MFNVPALETIERSPAAEFCLPDALANRNQEFTHEQRKKVRGNATSMTVFCTLVMNSGRLYLSSSYVFGGIDYTVSRGLNKNTIYAT